MSRWTAARCTTSVLEHGGSRISERAGSQETMPRGDRQRGRSLRLAEARSGSNQASFSGTASRPLQLRKGICSVARSILGRGRARHPPTSQQKAVWNDRHDARLGSQSWTSREPTAVRSVSHGETQERAGLGPRGGPSGGTVTDPKRIDDESVIGPARGQRKAPGLIAMTQGAGPKAGPPASPPLFGR